MTTPMHDDPTYNGEDCRIFLRSSISKVTRNSSVRLFNYSVFSKRLLYSTDRDKLEALSTDKEKVKYFLDKVIEPGLKIGYTDQFNEMLALMEMNDQ